MLSKKRQEEREQLALEQRAEYERAVADGTWVEEPETPESLLNFYSSYLDMKDAAIDCMMDEGARPSEIYEALMDLDWDRGMFDFGYAEMRLDFYYMKDPKKRIKH